MRPGLPWTQRAALPGLILTSLGVAVALLVADLFSAQVLKAEVASFSLSGSGPLPPNWDVLFQTDTGRPATTS
jgi:hypothetical protein